MNLKSIIQPIQIARAALLAGGIALTAGAASAESLTGAYLAGRHAAVTNDLEAAARYFTRALSLNAQDPQLMEQAMIFRVAAGDMAQAVVLSQRLIALEPDNRMANLVLTTEAIKAGRFAEARARIDNSDDMALNNPMVSMLGAWSAQGEGDNAAALSALSALDDRPVLRFFGRYHAGLILSLQGDMDAAEQAFSDAIAMASATTPRLADAFGRVLERAGKRDEARGLYLSALEKSPNNLVLKASLARLASGVKPELIVRTPAEGAAEALFGFASALSQDNGKRFALLYVRLAAYLRPGFSGGSLLLGDLLGDHRQWALAVKAYDEVGVDSPLYLNAQIGKASALGRLERSDDSVGVLRALTRDFPDNLRSHMALGDALRRNERYAEAAAAYDGAVKLINTPERRNWPVFYSRGVSNERAGHWPLAEKDLLTALKLAPDQPLVLNYLGYSWAEKGLNLDKAQAMIAKAVELRPQDGYITDSLGWVLYQRRDFVGAAEKLERAVELQPVDSVINDHYGDALWQVGRKMEARFQWNRALSFEPGEKDRPRILRKLEVGLDKVLSEEAASGPTAKKAEKGQPEKPNGG